MRGGLCDNPVVGDEDWLAERFAGGEDGSLVGRKGSVDEDPMRYSAVSRKGDGGEVGFSLEVIGNGEGAAPIHGIEIPGCQLLLLSWMGQVKGVGSRVWHHGGLGEGRRWRVLSHRDVDNRVSDFTILKSFWVPIARLVFLEIF